MTEDTSPENLRKFLESNDPAMVRKELGDQKAIKILAQMIEWGDDPEIRHSAAEELADIGGKEVVEILIGLLTPDEPDAYWITEPAVQALAIIGDEEALEPLSHTFSDECERVKQFYMDHNPNSIDGPHYRDGHDAFLCYQTASAISRIGGKKAQEILLSSVMYQDPWWESNVAIGSLKDLGWKPGNDKEKIAELIAEHNWEGCKEMGKTAVKEAIISLDHPIYCFEDTTCVLGEIVEAVNTFGKEKVISVIEEKELGDSFGSAEEMIQALERMISSY